jgi:hypothetical protein
MIKTILLLVLNYFVNFFESFDYSTYVFCVIIATHVNFAVGWSPHLRNHKNEKKNSLDHVLYLFPT